MLPLGARNAASTRRRWHRSPAWARSSSALSRYSVAGGAFPDDRGPHRGVRSGALSRPPPLFQSRSGRAPRWRAGNIRDFEFSEIEGEERRFRFSRIINDQIAVTVGRKDVGGILPIIRIGAVPIEDERKRTPTTFRIHRSIYDDQRRRRSSQILETRPTLIRTIHPSYGCIEPDRRASPRHAPAHADGKPTAGSADQAFCAPLHADYRSRGRRSHMR
jgi:hypothetical protein